MLINVVMNNFSGVTGLTMGQSTPRPHTKGEGKSGKNKSHENCCFKEKCQPCLHFSDIIFFNADRQQCGDLNGGSPVQDVDFILPT